MTIIMHGEKKQDNAYKAPEVGITEGVQLNPNAIAQPWKRSAAE